MDSLTQIVLGAATGEAVLGKKVGNKALLWGAIAGTIPDLDVIIKWFTDDVTANEMHRGFTHSIVFCVLAAPVFGYLVSKLNKLATASWKDWSWLMFWGFFTHPILDAFTTWGTQLFWPFTYKVSFKTIFVVDPLYTVPFLICVIWVSFLKRNNPKRARINWIGISLSSFYLLVTVVLKWQSYTIFKQNLIDQKIPFTAIQNKPTPLNTVLWNANIKTENGYFLGNYSFLDTEQNIKFSFFPKNESLLQAHKNAPVVERLKNLTDYWYTLQRENGKLYFNDLRFGLMDVNLKKEEFAFRYLLEPDTTGKLQASQAKRNSQEIKPLLSDLWQRILGNKPKD